MISPRFWDKVQITNDCWNWQAAKIKDGYGVFYTPDGVTTAHRYIYQQLVGAIPPGYYVCHHCDNPSCVNPTHLFVGTPAENSEDMKRKGRQFRPAGEECSRSKLTAAAVMFIRALRPASLPEFALLAAKFGVRPQAIAKAARGETWKQVSQ